MEHLELDVMVDAPVDRVFAAMADWEAQGQWMLGTKVRTTGGDGVGVGATLEAFTGVGSLGFLDTMVITEWDPPHRVVVEHTGKVVRGLGVMEVFELPDNRSRFVWSEKLELPLGAVGKLGWSVVRPAFALGVQRSLDQFAQLVSTNQL
jgi:uncharacterized protein YndB with AHSA1/START domain